MQNERLKKPAITDKRSDPWSFQETDPDPERVNYASFLFVPNVSEALERNFRAGSCIVKKTAVDLSNRY
ncbi:hypothetical protein L596_001993 [Steinernema carpocapsae]|uniref:Uncharacterized protein n=1 Tax=Steinernema carpocapsae TaxID=34508 RepID=A0A4U8UPX3_STECR|nr:hypothetical protein L596_001993 [Steinernema carpocapsae]